MSTQDKPELPSDEELARMSREELVTLGGRLDGVEIIEYPDPFPVKGTRAEKRAERMVAFWFILAALAGVAFLGVFIFWPAKYEAPNGSAFQAYYFYTPALGLTLGVAILATGIGVLAYVKKFIPHELVVQEREHDGPSALVDQKTIVAHLADAGARSAITRRRLIYRSAGAGAGVLGAGLGVFVLGGLLRNPHAQSSGPDGLLHTGWMSKEGDTEKVFLRRNTGNSEEIVLVKPEDLDAGAMETVFPFRESERGNHAALSKALLKADNPVMLIRLRPEDAQRVIKHQGQEDFNYGDFYAYTKICSHLGCPTSLFEQRTNRILCPCHQSQFNALEYAKPIFGPATRKLAQLPIEVDPETGYFYAKHDFIEPVGPAYWERKS
jgi:ubiquinol-cytochrome c reductase iron-sulfur subunit